MNDSDIPGTAVERLVAEETNLISGAAEEQQTGWTDEQGVAQDVGMVNPETKKWVDLPDAIDRSDQVMNQLQTIEVGPKLLPRAWLDLPKAENAVLECDDLGVISKHIERPRQGERYFALCRYLARPVEFAPRPGKLAAGIAPYRAHDADIARMSKVLSFLLKKDLIGYARLGDVFGLKFDNFKFGHAGIAERLIDSDRPMGMLLAYVFSRGHVSDLELNAELGFEGFVAEGGKPTEPWPDHIVDALEV